MPARSRGPAARAPGSIPASARSIASFTGAATATASKSTKAIVWSAASMASISAARSSARACSTARATPPRWRSSTWSPGCRAGGFQLLDTQFVTDHLKIFGATEVSRRRYHKLLEAALVGEGDFSALPRGRADQRRGSAAPRRPSLLIISGRTAAARPAAATAAAGADRVARAGRAVVAIGRAAPAAPADPAARR